MANITYQYFHRGWLHGLSVVKYEPMQPSPCGYMPVLLSTNNITKRVLFLNITQVRDREDSSVYIFHPMCGFMYNTIMFDAMAHYANPGNDFFHFFCGSI